MNVQRRIETPITPIVRLGVDDIGVNLYIKRDDLLPFSFGGNKVRIVQEYFADMEKKGCNCIIGYGSTQSNLCRVLANLSATRKIPCHIITALDNGDKMINTNNQFLVDKAHAVSHICHKGEVADTVQATIEQCVSMGLKPYYIYGNRYGKGNEAVPIRAYAKVYKEIKCQQKDMGIKFDYIFLATGTGMTQAGLLAGQHELNGTEKIIGISISRDSETESEIVKKYLDIYCKEEKLSNIMDENILIEDRYLCGGYGKYDIEIENAIWDMYIKNGVSLDPTYTGKAFWGMKEYIKSMNNKNVLFIHTGGVPLFFDYINNTK